MIKRIIILSLIGSAIGISAQTNIDEVIRSGNLAAGYAGMINFAAEPDISAAKLRIEEPTGPDDTLRVLKFPLRHEFQLEDKSWKPIIQSTLSRFTLEATVPISSTEDIHTKWTAYSATLGGGARIPLSKHWSILSAADAGYAYLKNEADYGPIGDEFLKPVLTGKLFDWEAHAWMLNAHLALLYNQMFHSLEIDAHLSGTASHISSFKTTSDLQQFEENIGTLSFKIDATHPLGFSIGRYPIYGVGHYGHSSLIGDSSTNLGFSHLNEAGFSFKADIEHHGIPISSVSLGAMVLWGNNVSGWKILTGYRF